MNGVVPTPWVRPRWPRRAHEPDEFFTKKLLDLTQSPMRLLAIMNRPDLRNVNSGGQGRLVFGVLGSGGFPLSFTVIFEYDLPLEKRSKVGWARRWHQLASYTQPGFGLHNQTLAAITKEFTSNTFTARPNQSALLQIRTNEIDLGSPWQLREFNIDPVSHQMFQTTVKVTPADSFNNTAALKNYVNANEASILTQSHVIKLPLKLGGKSDENFGLNWNAAGIINPEARHKFGLTTCNGCHTGETGTTFTHVSVRSLGQEARLSGFLTGINAPDPVTGIVHQFADLDRRKVDMKNLITPVVAQPASRMGAPAPEPSDTDLATDVPMIAPSRVH